MAAADRPLGDGEISFGGNQDVSSLMNALEGAAVSAAAGQANAAVVVPAANTQPEAPPPAAEVPVTAAAAAADPGATGTSGFIPEPLSPAACWVMVD